MHGNETNRNTEAPGSVRVTLPLRPGVWAWTADPLGDLPRTGGAIPAARGTEQQLQPGRPDAGPGLGGGGGWGQAAQYLQSASSAVNPGDRSPCDSSWTARHPLPRLQKGLSLQAGCCRCPLPHTEPGEAAGVLTRETLPPSNCPPAWLPGLSGSQPLCPNSG